MKIKTISVLMGGLLAAQFAAATVEYNFTLATSANLNDNYSFYDSGVYDYSYKSSVGDWVRTLNETSTVLRTYQDAGQWFQDVSVKTVETSTQSTQLHSSQAINLSYQLNGSALGDQTIGITGALTGAEGWKYSVSAWGTPGSLTVGDFDFEVSPLLRGKVDGASLPLNTYTYTNSNIGAGPAPLIGSASAVASWSSYSEYPGVSIGNSFEAKAAAVMGGAINGLNIWMSSAETLGDIQTETWSNDLGTRIITQSIAAPVPEPETYAMLLAGLGLVGGIARRRKQASAS